LFLIGFLIAYIYGLYGYFKQNKTIKHLNATVAAQTEEIQNLQRELEALQPPPVTAGVADPTPAPEAPAADA
jgi:cell division protein FtsL